MNNIEIIFNIIQLSHLINYKEMAKQKPDFLPDLNNKNSLSNKKLQQN
jgi:hypothetical protein